MTIIQSCDDTEPRCNTSFTLSIPCVEIYAGTMTGVTRHMQENIWHNPIIFEETLQSNSYHSGSATPKLKHYLTQ